MIQLYGLKNCSTCKKAMQWLTQQGVDYRFTDYRDEPLPAQALVRYAQQLGGWEKLVNRASATWRKLTACEQAASSDDDWIMLISRHPALVRRPLTIYEDGSVTTGFNEARYRQNLSRT